MKISACYSHAAGLLLAAALLAALPAAAGEIIKWRDKEGNDHFSDSMADVPPEYRKQVETKEIKPAVKPREIKTTKFPWSDSAAPGGSSSAGENAEVKLKRIVVPYRAFEGTSRRIIIEVRFNGSQTAPMLLDTGAPGVVLFHNLAQRLGILDGDAGKLMVQAGGIGGSVPAILTVVERIEVGEASSEFVPVTVTPSVGGAFEGLVGMDFMSNYQMGIDSQRHQLVFQETPESAERPGGHDETWWRIQFYEFSQRKTGWRGYADRLRNGGDRGSKYMEFAEKQHTQAEKLLRRLDDYASNKGVPMSWRQY
jgi:hypothetical protein